MTVNVYRAGEIRVGKQLKTETVSTRVSGRTRQLIATAAALRKVTVSRFVAEAAKRAASRELLENGPVEGGKEVR